MKAYEQAGHTNPKWDKPAKSALEEFARLKSRDPGANPEVVTANVAAAMKSGCDDPFVNYLFIKYAMPETNSEEAFASAFYKTAMAMQASSYPPIRKFYAGFRATQQYALAYNWPTNWTVEMSSLQHQTIDQLSAVLADANTPSHEVYDACHEFLESQKRNKIGYPKFWESMEPLVFKYWPDAYSIWLLKGEANYNLAWLARGSGYADKVSEEGWKSFREHLAIAESATKKSWELDSTDSIAPTLMIRIDEGLQKNRQDMELWFNRAMQINPNNYAACEFKLHYLYPQWYGSREDMIAFGRECVASKIWGGTVPLILSDAHREYWLYLQDSEEKTNYWKRPDVWPDIKASFDRFFELNPDATSYYHNYAWYAYHAEQWDKLNELLPKLGTVNYDYFGGKEEFNKMVQLTKEHTGGIGSQNK